ncbi:hypothetical protein CRM22_002153 [Opisthorchis felineus]|uniref:Uncharacterized protein n=2 Tax=Opisthorchis felineus TaxID=147828 RepID=A0A4S2M7E7_OPIFE|nr:hypothetical protein CRM22_002153 [Opisthorchis felineus]
MRENWSLLKKLSYETNKRLKQHVARAQKIEGEELARIERISLIKRVNRKQQIEYLKKNFHDPTYPLSGEASKCSANNAPDVNEDVGKCKEGVHILVGKSSKNVVGNLLEETLRMVKASPLIPHICVYKHNDEELEAENEITTSEAINVQSDGFGNHMDFNGESVVSTTEHQFFAGRQHQLTSEQQLTEGPDDENFPHPEETNETTPPSALNINEDPTPSISAAPSNSTCEELDTNPTLTLTKANSLDWLRTGTPPLDQKPTQATFVNMDPPGFDLDPVHVACETPQAQKFAASTVPVVRIAPSYTVSLMREAEPRSFSTKRDRRSSNRMSGPIINETNEWNDEVEFAAELLISGMNVLPAQIKQTDDLFYPDTAANKFQFSDPQSTPMAHYGTSTTERAHQNGLFHPDSIHITLLSSPHTPVRSSLENLKVTVNDSSSNDVANLYKRRCTSPFRGILKSNYSPRCTSLERPNGHPSMISELNVELARNSIEQSPSRFQNGSNGKDIYSSNGTKHSVCDSPDSFCSVSPRSTGKSVRFADEILTNGRISSSVDLSRKPGDLQRRGAYQKEIVHSEGPMVSVMSPKPTDDEQSSSPIWSDQYKLPSLRTPTRLSVGVRELPNNNGFINLFQETRVQNLPNSSPLVCEIPTLPPASTFNGTAKLRYSDLLGVRLKKPTEGDQYVHSKESSIRAPSVNAHVIAPAICLAAGDTSGNTNGTVRTIRDNKPPIRTGTLNSENVDNHYSQPNSNLDRKTFKPKVLDSGKLNEFIQNLSNAKYIGIQAEEFGTNCTSYPAYNQLSSISTSKNAGRTRKISPEPHAYNESKHPGYCPGFQGTPDYEGLDTPISWNGDLNNNPLTSFTNNPLHSVTSPVISIQKPPGTRRFSSVISQTAPHLAEQDLNRPSLSNAITHISLGSCDRGRDSSGDQRRRDSNRHPQMLPTQDVGKAPTDSLAEFIESERACQRNDQNPTDIFKPVSSRRLPASAVNLKKPGSKYRGGASTISVEESRLLQSLDRLNTRLNDLWSRKR